MEISGEKSKILVMGNKSPQHDISIKGGKLERVQSFKYLGACITEDGRSITEIETRIAIATTTLTRMAKIWKDKNISTASKIRLLRVLVISVVLYGCESIVDSNSGNRTKTRSI